MSFLEFFYSKMSKTKNKNTFISLKSKRNISHQPQIHKKSKKIESTILSKVLNNKNTELFSEKI